MIPNVNILMIDDNPAILLAAQTAFHGICDIVPAATGKSGIEAFRKHGPKAVILDIRLPDLNGLEVLAILKNIDPSIPVIILTAVDDTSVASSAIKAGAFTYLTKPLEFLSLLSVLHEAVDNGPVVNGIILPSVVTRNLFTEMTREFARSDTIVILGEKGVGKKAFARALHTRFHGSEQSFLLVNAATPECESTRSPGKDKYLTACVHFPASLVSDFATNECLLGFFRKTVITLEIPSFDRNSEIRLESTLPKRWKVFSIPPLRSRRNEALPLLCYWHQKFAPEKNLDRETATEAIADTGQRGFPGNVKAVVDIARELALKSSDENRGA